MGMSASNKEELVESLGDLYETFDMTRWFTEKLYYGSYNSMT